MRACGRPTAAGLESDHGGGSGSPTFAWATHSTSSRSRTDIGPGSGVLDPSGMGFGSIRAGCQRSGATYTRNAACPMVRRPPDADARTARSRRLPAQAAAGQPPLHRRRIAADGRRVEPQPQRPRQRRRDGPQLSRQAGARRRQRPHARQRGGAVPAPVGGVRGAARLRPAPARLRPRPRAADPRMDLAGCGPRTDRRVARRLPARAGGGARARAGGAARGRAGRRRAAPRRAVGAGAALPAAGGAALLQRGECRARQAPAGRRAAVPGRSTSCARAGRRWRSCIAT